MDRKKAVKNILSKFNEPRAVMKRTADGAEMTLESGKKIVGDSDESALSAYGAVFGTPEQSDKIVKDLADTVGSKKEQELQAALKKRQSLKSTSNPNGADDTDDISLPKAGLGDKVVNADNFARNKLLKAVASKLGRNLASDDSSENAFQVVDAAAEKLGVDPNSPALNAAKAAAVTAIEMAPLNPSDLVGGKIISKLGAGAKSALGAARKSEMTKKVFERLKDPGAVQRLSSLADAVQNKAKPANALQAAKASSDLDKFAIKPRNFAQELADKGAKKVNATHIVKARK